MFSCCHPRLPEEAQVALVLHILCGFGVERNRGGVSRAADAAIEKRIARAKKVLAGSKRLFDLGGRRLRGAALGGAARAVPAVQRGLPRRSADAAVRAELCEEAMRLVELLLEHPLTATPATHALARAHVSARGAASRRAWTRRASCSSSPTRIGRGGTRAASSRAAELLEPSAAGAELSEYHVEAAIAAVHAESPSAEDTDWNEIVSLYDRADARSAPSPVVAFNRAIAVAQRDGPERGLEEIERDQGPRAAKRYPFYYAAVAEFELQLGRPAEARDSFAQALKLARNPAERRFLQEKMSNLALLERH